MSILRSKFFSKYFLPGFVFQSLIIGGGYGTGRELVEFFMNEGPLGGLWGMLLAMAIWSIVLAVSFELARLGKNYNYRSFMNSILGKGWIGYEVVYSIGLILVISVLGSASGKLLYNMFELPEIVGVLVMMLVVGLLVFYGSSLIEKVLSIWSFALYAVFFIIIVICLIFFGDVITKNIGIYQEGSQWFLGGLKYSAYNIGIMPAILFVVRHIETRKEALISGTIAGAMGMIPGLFIFIAMLSQYPEILTQPLPADFLLSKLGYPIFYLIFQIILLGTFIETGVGLIHGFNERIAGVYQEKGAEMPRLLRVGIGVGILILAVFIADAVGIVKLIAKGYGALTWGYMIAFVIPVLTLGVWRIVKTN